MLWPEMLKPRGQTDLEVKNLASASASDQTVTPRFTYLCSNLLFAILKHSSYTYIHSTLTLLIFDARAYISWLNKWQQLTAIDHFPFASGLDLGLGLGVKRLASFNISGYDIYGTYSVNSTRNSIDQREIRPRLGLSLRVHFSDSTLQWWKGNRNNNLRLSVH